MQHVSERSPIDVGQRDENMNVIGMINRSPGNTL